jgi:hypothetical protein
MCQVFVGTKGERAYFSLAKAGMDRYFKIRSQESGAKSREQLFWILNSDS